MNKITRYLFICFLIFHLPVSAQPPALDPCWATLYDGHKYHGRQLHLVGVSSYKSLKFPFGNEWEGDIDSVKVGPKGTLYLYGRPNFADLDSIIKSDQSVPDLRHKPSTDSIESVKLVCAK